MLIRRASMFFLTAGLLLSPITTAVAEEEKPKAVITPIAIGIKKEAKADNGEDVVFGQPGTEVTLLIKGADKKRVIEFDRDRSKLDSLSDNLGNKLNKPNDWGFQFWQASNDGSVGTVRVSASGLPAKNATELQIKAELALAIASKQETKETKNVALKKGSKFTVGDFAVEISKAGEPDFSDAEMEVTLKFNQDITGIAEVVFLDTAGKVLESSRNSTSTSRFGNRVSAQVGYDLTKKADIATVQFKLWTDMEQVKVPVDLKIGLGL